MRMINKPWSAIALALNRTPTSCRDMGRQLRTPNARTGEWTAEEVAYLRDLYDELNGTARNGGVRLDILSSFLPNSDSVLPGSRQ
jgi:hypothetical protein